MRLRPDFSPKDYSDDFLEVFHSLRLRKRLPGSLPECQKMDLPSLPQRIYTLGEKPPAHKSISYHTDDTNLFNALRRALNDDEYEELKESKLGVFIKFKEMNFGWASRLVHYMLGFQLNIKKKYELWSLVGPQPVRFSQLEFEHITGLNCDYIEDLENPRVEVTKEMAAFWEMMGVDVDAGPSTGHIKVAFGRCEEWSQEDRMRLGYLAIFTGFIEGRKYSTATRASLARLVMDLERFENYHWGRVAFKVLMESLKGVNLESNSYTVDGFVQVLQVWAYFALPEFGANYGHPLPNRPSPLMLAYDGGKGHIFFKEAISKHVFKLHSLRLHRRLKASRLTSVINFVQKDFAEMFPRWDFAENIIKVMFNAKANLNWTMNCWEVTGTKSRVKKEENAAETESGVKEESAVPRKKARKAAFVEACKVPSVEASKVPSAEARAEARSEARSEASTCVGGMTKEQIEKSFKGIADVMRDGFGMCLREIKLLEDRLKAVEKKSESVNGAKAGQNGGKAGQNDPQEPSSSKDLSVVIANEPPEHSGEPRVLVLDNEVPTDSDLHKGEIRRHGTNILPIYEGWGLDVDDIYALVNFRNEHWIAIWISISKRHIVVWDSILTHIKAADLDVLMEPFVNMVPYLLVECAGSDEERVKHTLEPYTYERVTVGVPQCRAGDCGVFAGSTSNVMLLGCHFLQRFVTRT
ncbi:hypothetical protein F2Q70_00016193 [Brassica cretica]|uniref:Ubiquitin-like protease family profile domain-containing protein n=1 Tax=Brassica cretica TaxID=69181 RepID=A0A8S9I3Q2_BRACR|nr:hypothetical protein F2Q70_00016193 [Brassica cretica]